MTTFPRVVAVLGVRVTDLPQFVVLCLPALVAFSVPPIAERKGHLPATAQRIAGQVNPLVRPGDSLTLVRHPDLETYNVCAGFRLENGCNGVAINVGLGEPESLVAQGDEQIARLDSDLQAP